MQSSFLFIYFFFTSMHMLSVGYMYGHVMRISMDADFLVQI